jgi:hypothetical protein
MSKKQYEFMQKTDSDIQAGTNAGSITAISAQPTERAILKRLGKNAETKLPEAHRERIARAIREGIALCRPQGAWRRMPILANDGSCVVLDETSRLEGSSIAAMLAASNSVLLIAATAGTAISDRLHDTFTTDPAAAVVYDAVGSESADAALDWLQTYLRQIWLRRGEFVTKRRFSPGYGDCGMENQRTVHRLLGLESIGIRITESSMLIPEKSVIGIAGIESSPQNRENNET